MKARWRTKKLGELLEIQNGFAFNSKFFSSDGTMPLIRIRDLKDGINTETRYSGDYDQKYIVEAGDLLIGMDGEFGCYEWKGSTALLNQRVCRLQNFKQTLHPRFVFYGINSFLKDIEELTGFTTVKHLSSKQVLGIEFPVPPLHEQQRIVIILDKAFEGIATATANAEKNLANARELFQGYLQSVFDQTGKAWHKRRLGDVVTRLTNGYVGPTRNIYINSGIPYLLARHVRANRLSFDGKTYISEDFNLKHKKSVLKAGDVLLVQSGHIGHSAVVPREHEGHNCHAMIVITPILNILTGHFLSLYFSSPQMQQKFEEIRSGSTVPHLTCGEVRELMIGLPELRVQEAIVQHALEVQQESQRLEAIYQQKLSALNELKKSILHQAFTGQLH